MADEDEEEAAVECLVLGGRVKTVTALGSEIVNDGLRSRFTVVSRAGATFFAGGNNVPSGPVTPPSNPAAVAGLFRGGATGFIWYSR